ncbi:hypothetical protein JKF63_05695 [Porcisia hertigi]|uniref:Uncharacterized protein n=1 Tax=Porcisia hertigi TaxID=2761500 RepID=A0A836LCY2_9TRYP|nr:hypothetical protein JKF63_05695 [Porcisia hertigi]
MKRLQAERDALLLYVLQHPPPNVSLKLPDGCTSLERVDLTTCPSPVALYAEAEKAVQHANGKKVPIFEFDMTKCFIVVGGSSGNVQRTWNASSSHQGRRSSSLRGLLLNSETKADVLSVNERQHSSRNNNLLVSLVRRKSPFSSSEDRGESHAQQVGASKKSLPGTSQLPPGESSSAAAGGNRGFLGQLLRLLKSLGNVEESTAGLGDAFVGSSHPPSTLNSSIDSAAAKGKVPLSPMTTGSATGGILASVWSPLSSSMRGTRRNSRTINQLGSSREEPDALDVAQRLEQLQIPLCGTTSGTISFNIASRLDPVFDVAAEQRRIEEETTAANISFPRAPRIQLCEVIDSAPLAPFLDTLHIFAYESLLMATGVLLTKKQDKYARELENVYRRVFSITDEQHARSLANVTPPGLRQALEGGGAMLKQECLRYLSELRPNAATFRLLCDNSNDDSFVSRAEQLLSVIERYPDLPGDTYVPFAVRAMIFAACLVPLHQLHLCTLNPIYSEGHVENCLAALRTYFGILPQTEHFCHLHAQLLASDQCGSVEAQAVFLKDVARAVSHCNITSIAEAPLTPPVKYAYYVLQETFCLAAVPMPWLDSSFSADMQRSVTAAFIETCLALPPCMPSAMVLVEGAVVLPPTAHSEDILLALMDVFVNSGVFRNYAEMVSDKADAHHLSAETLFQRIAKGLDTGQRAYCQMLTRSFPLATMLIVPGRLRIGAYVLLSQLWGNLYPGATNDAPKDYKVSLDALLDYLLDGCNGEQRTIESEPLCALLMRATRRYLAPLDTLARCDEAVHIKSAKQLMEKITLQWAGTVERAKAPSDNVVRYVRAVFEAPRPPPLGGDPAAQQNSRLCNCLEVVTALIRRCMEGFPSVSAADTDDKLPFLAAESRRVRAACVKLRGFPALVPGAVHRLHTLARVQRGFDECLARSHRQYDRVRRVTGAPPVSTEEIKDEFWRSFYAAVLQLCDSLSIHILTQDAILGLMSKYMRVDVKKFKSAKRRASTLEDFSSPRLHPAVTMGRILDEVRRALEDVCRAIDFDVAARQLHYRLCYNFTAWLFALYFEEPVAFLNPTDASLILTDLDAVRAFFKVKPYHPDTLPVGVSSERDQGAVQSLHVLSADLLDKLYSVVQYVVTKPSSELVTGGVGVPPLHRLPECSNDSPLCQYVARRVLEHRKDFKSSTCENYKARALSH